MSVRGVGPGGSRTPPKPTPRSSPIPPKAVAAPVERAAVLQPSTSSKMLLTQNRPLASEGPRSDDPLLPDLSAVMYDLDLLTADLEEGMLSVEEDLRQLELAERPFDNSSSLEGSVEEEEPQQASTSSSSILERALQAAGPGRKRGTAASSRRYGLRSTRSAVGLAPNVKLKNKRDSDAEAHTAGTSINALLVATSQADDHAKGAFLDKEEELRLAVLAKRWLDMQDTQDHLKALLKRRPSRSEVSQAIGLSEQEIAMLVLSGREAYNTLVQKNLRLVLNLVRRYASTGPGHRAYDDMMAAGMDGLRRAITKFDPSKGWRLTTYATFWIKQRIIRNEENTRSIVRIPLHHQHLADKLRRMRADMQSQLRREPSASELAAAAGVKETDVTQALAMYARMSAVSLDTSTPGHEEGSDTLHDKINEGQDDDDDGGTPVVGRATALTTYAGEELSLQLDALLLGRLALAPQTVRAFKMLMGLPPYARQFQPGEVAKALKMPRHAVSSAEEAVLGSLRSSPAAMSLMGELLEPHMRAGALASLTGAGGGGRRAGGLRKSK